MTLTNGDQEDWFAVLAAFEKGDPVAVAKVTAVITGFLARYGAYDFRDSWGDIVQDVLIKLFNGGIREPMLDGL